MSQPAPEPASAPTLRHIPRRYLALGLIIVAICLLGALVLVRDNSGPSTSSTVETFNPAPSSLVSTRGGACPRRSTTPSGSRSPANPVHAAAAGGDGRRPAVAGHGRRRAAQAGRVLLRRRVRALRRGPALAAVLALSRFGTFNQLGRHAVERDDRVRQPVDVHLLERVVHEPYVDPPVGRALQLAEPDGRAVSRPRRRPTPGRPRPSPATGRAPTTFALLDVANRYVLSGASLRSRRPGRALTGPDRRGPRHAGQPADPGRRGGGQRDHGHHLLGRRRAGPARCASSRGVLAADDALKITRPALRRAGSGELGQLARRSSISLRSTSFMPPQIPWGSRIRMA